MAMDRPSSSTVPAVRPVLQHLFNRFRANDEKLTEIVLWDYFGFEFNQVSNELPM